MMQLTDQDLLLRLKQFEDNFVERKLFSDGSKWLKAAVALANSAPIGFPAVLFIGVKDDGTPEDRPETDLENVQRTFMQKINGGYPPVPCFPRVLNVDGRQILAVVIPGSPERPHFAGLAYVRKGSDSVPASEEKFAELIAMRQSKVYEILKWKGKAVTVHWYHPRPGATREYGFARRDSSVIDCNQFFATIVGEDGEPLSVPLERVVLSCDQPQCRLLLEVRLRPG